MLPSLPVNRIAAFQHARQMTDHKQISIKTAQSPPTFGVCASKEMRESVGKSEDLFAEIESDMGIIVRRIGKVPRGLAVAMKQDGRQILWLTGDEFRLLNCKPGSNVTVRQAETNVECP